MSRVRFQGIGLRLGLKAGSEQACDPQDDDLEEELLALLRGMGDALNPDCEFHCFNQDSPLPSERHKARSASASHLR